MTEKQFWKWLFQEVDSDLLYVIKNNAKITVNGFRINSAQDIKKENHSFIVNAFLQPKNLKSIKKELQTKKFVTANNDDEENFEFKIDKVNETIKSRSDLVKALLYLVQEKQEELALEVFKHFSDKIDLMPKDSNVVVENSDGSKKKIEKTNNDEKKIKKLETDLRKAKDDLKKKTDELKDVKGLMKDEKKQATNQQNEAKKEFQKQKLDTKIKYEEKLKTHAIKINELMIKIKLLEEENKELSKSNNGLTNEITILKNSKKEYEELIELYEIDKEKERIASKHMTITIIGKLPMGGVPIKNASVRFELFEDIEFLSHQLPKNDKCWVLRYTLNNRERDDLLHNEHFVSLDNVVYFDDYMKFSNALNSIEKVEVRV
jgi:hypothetical protein